MRRTDIKLFVLIALLAGLLLAVYSCSPTKDPADSEPPTVAITNPENDSRVPNTVDVTAEATDNKAVTKVEFYIDDQLYYTDETPPWGCCWSISEESTGEHILFAKAFDAAGNNDRSDLITVTCDNAPPATIDDLAATAPDVHGDLTLTWTAPGEDGSTGTASLYDVRYYWVAITADNWTSAIPMEGEPDPQVAESAESYDVTGLNRGMTYFFAVRTQDSADNWSGVSNCVSVTTMGLFDDPVTYDIGDTLNRDIVVADFNGDTYLDLAVSHRHADNNVSLLYGNGDGTFDPTPVVLSTPGNVSTLYAEDLDNDGELDFVAPNWSANDTVISHVAFPLDIDTTWSGEIIISIDTSCLKEVDTTLVQGVSAVNFIFDDGGETYVNLEHYDFFDTSYQHCDPGGIIPCMYCLMYSPTLFRCPSEVCPELDIISYDSTQVIYFGDDNPMSVCAADFDDDGLVDVAMANNGTANISFIYNDGDRWFSTPVNVSSGANRPSSVCTADFDLDGRPDLAIANAAADRVSVIRNLGNRTFGTAVMYDVQDEPIYIVPVDVDGNGYMDLAVSNFTSSDVSVLINNSNGTCTFNTADRIYGCGWGPTGIDAADLTGDGTPELVVANYNDGTISVLVNEGLFRYYSYNTITIDVETGPRGVKCADFDGDGDNDIVVLNQIDRSISILINRSVE